MVIPLDSREKIGQNASVGRALIVLRDGLSYHEDARCFT